MSDSFSNPSDSITVVVPACNEEANLAATIKEILQAVEDEFEAYEILIFNDCSTDGTSKVADNLAAQNSNIIVYHNPKNMGLGWNFREAIKKARMSYFTIVYGKHDIGAEQLKKIFKLRGKVDIIIPYHTNGYERVVFRRFVSRLYTYLLNLLFRYQLHYYNDSHLHRTEIIKKLKLATNSYGFSAEVLIKALRSGCTFVEVPIVNIFPPGIETSAFKLKNIVGVSLFLLRLLYDIYISGSYRYES